MKYLDNIREVAHLQPDYLGFIFYEKSPRFFEGTMPEIDPNIKKTGVFVNSEVNEINQKINQYDLKAVQLHGDETADFCIKIKQKNPTIEIIKAFSVDELFDFSILKDYIGKIDYFLFDTKGKNRGGNGTLFDWSLLQKYPYSVPFFLSGGIGISESEKIKSLENSNLPIHAIDINSKFESAPGMKNIQLLNEFIS